VDRLIPKIARRRDWPRTHVFKVLQRAGSAVIADRRSTRSASSGNRAAATAAGNVNSSLADLAGGGAGAAVAMGVASNVAPVQGRLLVTITIFIQPTP